jgi:hypothetical protein
MREVAADVRHATINLVIAPTLVACCEHAIADVPTGDLSVTPAHSVSPALGPVETWRLFAYLAVAVALAGIYKLALAIGSVT